jgi:hypothetical protein
MWREEGQRPRCHERLGVLGVLAGTGNCTKLWFIFRGEVVALVAVVGHTPLL